MRTSKSNHLARRICGSISTQTQAKLLLLNLGIQNISLNINGKGSLHGLNQDLLPVLQGKYESLIWQMHHKCSKIMNISVKYALYLFPVNQKNWNQITYPSSEQQPWNIPHQYSLIPTVFSPETMRTKFHALMTDYDEIFNPAGKVYSGASGPFKARVNMGPAEQPQQKGRLPLYSSNKLLESQ